MNNKFVYVFYRQGVEFNRYASQPKTDDNRISMSSSNSVNSFPIADLNIEDANLNAIVMNFGNQDIAEIHMINEAGIQNLLFKGEFRSKQMSYGKSKPEWSIKLGLIHSCYILTMRKFKGARDYREEKLGDVIRDIFREAECGAELVISPAANDLIVNVNSHTVNIYRFIKELCLVYDLSLEFRADNIVNLEMTHEKAARFNNVNPISLTDDDIIEMKKFDEGDINLPSTLG